MARILESLNAGDRSAVDRLVPLVYGELRGIAGRLMRRERPEHTLQPTELVNEAYMRLVGQNRVEWQGKTRFLAIGAEAMRRILVDRRPHGHDAPLRTEELRHRPFRRPRGRLRHRRSAAKTEAG